MSITFKWIFIKYKKASLNSKIRMNVERSVSCGIYNIQAGHPKYYDISFEQFSRYTVQLEQHKFHEIRIDGNHR